MSDLPGATDHPEVLAVLLALAGVRTGEWVAAVGTGDRLVQGLLAMSGDDGPVRARAGVVVARGPGHVAEAVSRAAPGGRLVALAPDEALAQRDARSHGVRLQHVVAVARRTGRVAWSGTLAD